MLECDLTSILAELEAERFQDSSESKCAAVGQVLSTLLTRSLRKFY